LILEENLIHADSQPVFPPDMTKPWASWEDLVRAVEERNEEGEEGTKII